MVDPHLHSDRLLLHIWHKLAIFPPLNLATSGLNVELEEITVSEHLALQIVQ